MRSHYAANRDYYVAKARRRQRRVVAENRAWLYYYLREHPCVDCGAGDLRVLEFDHKDPRHKVASVSVLARSGYPLRRVQEEVTKCEVRCANCHRIKTHEQFGWWAAALVEEVRAWRDSNPQTF